MTPPRQPAPALPPQAPAGLDEAMLRQVVEAFYAHARTDPLIGPIFRRHVPDEHWQAHIAKITAFWSSSLLGTGTYDGRPMPKHLAIRELSDAHFRRWLALFCAMAERHCPPDAAEALTTRARRIAEAFRAQIAMHRGEGMRFAKPLEPETWP